MGKVTPLHRTTFVETPASVRAAHLMIEAATTAKWRIRSLWFVLGTAAGLLAAAVLIIALRPFA